MGVNPSDKLDHRKCIYCEVMFAPYTDAQRTCGSEACIARRRREYCRVWYAANRENQIRDAIARRKRDKA
jgi:hypothetical protein